jgi:sugar lactone lactonase YvrE
MSSAISRIVSGALDAFLGRGAYAVTVPPMDGPLQPNNDLENAEGALHVAAPDNLILVDRAINFSSGSELFEFDPRTGTARSLADLGATVSALAALPDGGIAAGLVNGEIVFRGGANHGASIAAMGDYKGVCPTALLAVGDALVVAQGSAARGPSEWCHDLLERGASGSVWRLDLRNRTAVCLAGGMAYPNGLALHGDGRVVTSESWRHRLVKLSSDGSKPEIVLEHLPGYPSRLAPAAGGGYWLTVFAPRSALIEFVLREGEFKRQMMADIPEEFWVAPCLASGKSFKEPMQNGAIKTMGILKPWAPTRSYGLLVRLGRDLSPMASRHSRSDGRRHGITSAVEIAGTVYVTSKGGNEILSLPSDGPSR